MRQPAGGGCGADCGGRGAGFCAAGGSLTIGGMTRRTRICCIGCGLIGIALIGGCSQTERRAVAQSAAANAVAAAGGQATSTAAGTTVPRRREPLIKPNGRGGYDSSAAQAAALKRAHYMSDKYGTINRTRRPTTRPATR